MRHQYGADRHAGSGPQVHVQLHERRGHGLQAWLTNAETSPIREIATFAAGPCKDWKAVVAGLTLPHSTGKVECHINKMLKRNMFGRANHQSLRQCILLNAWAAGSPRLQQSHFILSIDKRRSFSKDHYASRKTTTPL